MRIRLFLGILVGLLVVSALRGVAGQTFPTPIAEAIALVTTGVTPFTNEGLVADAYINWGTGRGTAGYGFRDNAGVIESKNSGGVWAPLTTTGAAPSSATYITQTAHASLSAEQALSTLATAFLINTTGTGVLTAYAGVTCTNQVLTAVSAAGVGTCEAVTLTTDIAGTLPVANGGTGAATLTGMLIGNGTSAVTAATSSTVGQVVRVTGANTYAWGAVNLSDTDAITGTLPVANGGTGLTAGTSGGVLAYTATGTLASSGALTANRIVLGGGAGAVPTVLGSLGTTTTVLHGNAAGVPSFAAVDLATTTTGNLPATRGGTDQTVYTVGDLLYASTTTALSKLAASTAGTLLRSTGAGSAPAWSTTIWPNSATAGDLVHASGANTYANLAAVATGRYLRSAGTGTAPIWSTLILPNAATTGDLLYASATDTLAMLAAVGVGQVLTSAGVGVAPAWSATPSATSWTASTAFIGSGTTATTGIIRLANAGVIAARDQANLGNISLLQADANDFVYLGNAEAMGFSVEARSDNLYWQFTVPTISSGFGAAPTIAGIAAAFKVTVGGGGAASGVVLFNTTWATAPSCTANNETTAQLVRATPTATQVTLTGTLAASDVVSVLCVGY